MISVDLICWALSEGIYQAVDIAIVERCIVHAVYYALESQRAQSREEFNHLAKLVRVAL